MDAEVVARAKLRALAPDVISDPSALYNLTVKATPDTEKTEPETTPA
jgi:hypothetical protein